MVMFFGILFLVAVESVFCQLRTTCPSKEGISPCQCKLDNNNLPWLSCTGITSLDQFQKSSKLMKGYKFSSLYIIYSNFGRLPSELFLGMEIQSLKISYTNLTGLGDGGNRPPFLGLDNSLEDIGIKEACIDDLKPMTSFSLAHLKKLTLFESINNMVPTIPNDWFESGPYGLKQVLFEGSMTRQLGSHAFSSLINVKEISVTGGTISKVTRAMFPKPANHLTVLDLSDNALSSLPADFFRWMPSITEVYLDNNAFTEINELAWSTVWNQVTHVYYHGNPMECNENIKWIYKYRLPEVLGGSCVKPPNLKSKDLQKLTIKDFQ